MNSSDPKPKNFFLKRLQYSVNPPTVGNKFSDIFITPLLTLSVVVLSTLFYGVLKVLEILLHTESSFLFQKAE